MSIIFNSICAVPACLLNLLVIIAVWKKQQLHTPSNVLLSNLALTDFGVGCIVQPLFVAHKIGAIQGNISLHCIASLASKTLASVLGVVSLTTLTAISIDRLLALILNVRYRIVVTLRFTARTVGVLCILSIILTLPLFIYPLSFVYCMVLLGAICFLWPRSRMLSYCVWYSDSNAEFRRIFMLHRTTKQRHKLRLHSTPRE